MTNCSTLLNLLHEHRQTDEANLVDALHGCKRSQQGVRYLGDEYIFALQQRNNEAMATRLETSLAILQENTRRSKATGTQSLNKT